MVEEHVAYVCAEIEKETKHMETYKAVNNESKWKKAKKKKKDHEKSLVKAERTKNQFEQQRLMVLTWISNHMQADGQHDASDEDSDSDVSLTGFNGI